jgi:putative tricarboxylic transport membrane protein
MRNLERCLALALLVVGALGIYAASGLPLWDEFTVGPGAAPIAYGAVLAFCAGAVALRPISSGPIDWGPYFPRAVLMVALAAALAFSIDYIGFTAGLFAFSFAGLLLVARVKLINALVLAVAWVAILYLVFVQLLNIPFPQGAWL